MMKSNGRQPKAAQGGAVLMIGLVMLLMLTLVALGIARLATRHTQVVNNEQVRTEAASAANYVLDFVLNSPASTWIGYSGAGAVVYANQGTTKAADSADVAVSVTVKNLSCKRGRILTNAELIKTVGGVAQVAEEDQSCFGGGGTPLTIVDTSALGLPSENSLCGTVLWNMDAETTDPRLLSAKAVVTQGVEVRETVTTLEAGCT